MPDSSDNIRDFLGGLIGKTILDVTTDDWDVVSAKHPDSNFRESFAYLHLSDGTTLAFAVLGRAGFAYPFEQEEEPRAWNDDGSGCPFDGSA